MINKQLENFYKTVLAAFSYIKEYFPEYCRALCIPIFLIVLGGFLISGVVWNGFWILILFLFCQLFFNLLIAVITHRITLLGASSVNRWGVYLPGKRELFFALYSICLAIIIVIIKLALSNIPVVGQYLFYLVAGYFLARLSLVLPAVAIDNHPSFIDSWKATKEHQLFMFGVVFIFPMAVKLLIGFVSFLPYIDFIILFSSTIATVFTITMLSIAFKIIEEEYK